MIFTVYHFALKRVGLSMMYVLQRKKKKTKQKSVGADGDSGENRYEQKEHKDLRQQDEQTPIRKACGAKKNQTNKNSQIMRTER